MGEGEPGDQDGYTEDEAKRRFEAALRAAMNTPPKPHKDEPKKRPKKASAAATERTKRPNSSR